MQVPRIPRGVPCPSIRKETRRCHSFGQNNEPILETLDMKPCFSSLDEEKEQIGQDLLMARIVLR